MCRFMPCYPVTAILAVGRYVSAGVRHPAGAPPHRQVGPPNRPAACRTRARTELGRTPPWRPSRRPSPCAAMWIWKHRAVHTSSRPSGAACAVRSRDRCQALTASAERLAGVCHQLQISCKGLYMICCGCQWFIYAPYSARVSFPTWAVWSVLVVVLDTKGFEDEERGRERLRVRSTCERYRRRGLPTSSPPSRQAAGRVGRTTIRPGGGPVRTGRRRARGRGRSRAVPGRLAPRARGRRSG